MKNQYLGDLGDYGKYGLLRYLAHKNIRIGVNWYLTEDDGSNDGKFVSYLDKEDDRLYDPQLFDELRKMVYSQNKNVGMVNECELIPEASYYCPLLESKTVLLNERNRVRSQWHQNALKCLDGVELIFADPDNGIIGSKTVSDNDAEKYITPEEIKDYYDRGQNVMYYCHKARRTHEQWEKAKTVMQNFIPDAKIIVLTSHRGTQRSYIFVIHPEHFEQYDKVLDEFLMLPWKDMFSRESIDGKKIEEPQVKKTIVPQKVQKKKTTETGYINRNQQENLGKTSEKGSLHGQYFYQMKCLKCSAIYKANASDIFQRKCPRCQGGRP